MLRTRGSIANFFRCQYRAEFVVFQHKDFYRLILGQENVATAARRHKRYTPRRYFAVQHQHISKAYPSDDLSDQTPKPKGETHDFADVPLHSSPSSITSADLHVVANNIQHWCSKDVEFFHATMKFLNLSSLAMDDNSEGSPLSEMLKEYRRLYYESLSDFRTYINSNPKELRPVLFTLVQGGLGNVEFSRQYRKVRAYESHKEQLERIIYKQKADIERRMDHITNSEVELKDYKETARLSAKQRRRQILKDFKVQLSSRSESINTTSPPDYASSSSVWNKVAKWWGHKEEEDTSSKIDTHISSSDIFEPFCLPTIRQRNRVRSKVDAVHALKVDLELAKEELRKQQSAFEGLEFPLPREDYEEGQKLIENARDSICKELALQISKRHAELIDHYQRLDEKTDLTKPWEWFGYARLDQRKIIFHAGPTNSGKTYNALKRLKEAEEGLYLGPLRLLAAEVYEALTADGIYTNLFTGQEKREIPFSTHASATVEMVSFDKEYDVVVIDEIQMISDATRGGAWTKALLGIRCKEIHVCGGLEALNIVKKLAHACGDEFELKEYERFSPLKLATESMTNDPKKPGCYRNVKPGDCVVAFSRNDIFAIKREIENTTNYKCCVIYGKLPPQTRADQARRFNDPNSEYDILVASDAIGMGLNLNIKRIIFNSIFKYNGESVIRLSHSEIKQISGRAGRRNSPYPHGEVTCRDPRDLSYIQECLESEIAQIEKAALLPTTSHIEVFNESVKTYDTKEKEADLHKILRQFSAMATVKGDFFLGRQTEMQSIAKSLQGLPLTLQDAYAMCMSPVASDSMYLLQTFARKLSMGEVSGLPSRPIPKVAKSFDDISYLCTLYGDADLFLWLQFKFPPGNALEQQAAIARKELVLKLINESLANSDELNLNHDYIRGATRHRTIWEAENPLLMTGSFFGEEESDDDEDDDAYAAFSQKNRYA